MAGPDESIEVVAEELHLQPKVKWLEDRAKDIYMAIVRVDMAKPHAGDRRKLFAYARELADIGDLWAEETKLPF